MSAKDPAAPKKRSWPMIFMCIWLIGLTVALVFFLGKQTDLKPAGKKNVTKKTIAAKGTAKVKKGIAKKVIGKEAKPTLNPDTAGASGLEDKIRILEEKLSESEKNREMEKQEYQKTIESLLSRVESLEKSILSRPAKKAASKRPAVKKTTKQTAVKKSPSQAVGAKQEELKAGKSRRDISSIQPTHKRKTPASAPAGSWGSTPPPSKGSGSSWNQGSSSSWNQKAVPTSSYTPPRRRTEYEGPWASQGDTRISGKKEYSGSSTRTLYDMSIRYGGAGDKGRSKLAPGVAVYPRH